MLLTLLNIPPFFKKLLLFSIDGIAIPFSLWLALSLRYGKIYTDFAYTSFLVFAGLTVLSLSVFVSIGMHRAVLRYAGLKMLETVGVGVLASTGILIALVFLGQEAGFPRSVFIIYGALLFILVGGVRILALRLLGASKSHFNKGKPVAIYGAGDGGRQLVGLLHNGSEYTPVAFLDDDAQLQGRDVEGLKVFDPSESEELNFLQRKGVEEILLAIPSASMDQRKKIIKRLEPLPFYVRTVPDFQKIMSGKAQLDQLEELRLEDLLGRDPVAPDKALLGKCISGKPVLVTGAGGSIGSELCRQIFALNPTVLVLFEQSEFALYQIEHELRQMRIINGHDLEIIPVLGSVTHKNRLQNILSAYAVETVYHAAAYKHVPLVEHNPAEGVANNVFGTLQATEAAIQAGVSDFVLISTDKAVRPANVMGATKRMAEMVLQALQESHPEITLSMVRFGNVLGSSGSVVPLFRKQIKMGGPITVTHADVIRYFMTIPEAVQLVIQAGAIAQGGDVFVLDMGEPVKILDLAKQMIHLAGLKVQDEENPEGDIAIKFTGLRPGEKLYEELLIGENVSGTRHPMIMRAEEEMLPWNELEQLLVDMKQCMKEHDIDKLRALLLEAVKGYQPQHDIEDHIWKKNRSRTAQVETQIPAPADKLH
ncbi:MAG TPA: polysaccharide biosynthesis protein [Chromatiales bacterium]|nr:polysaccharide biosynthesis protein [Thiotrichales bacterium]HIP69727.1 polysaccharide biosynthesis protein [Chromatiales bacterium]